MRARITYWTVSPRTPQRLAQAGLQLLVLLAAVAGLAGILSGAASRAIFTAVLLGGQALGVAA